MRQPYTKLGLSALQRLRSSLRFDIISCTEEALEFDIINVDCVLVNTLRRLLMAEVPTVAVEKVLAYQNSSLLPDEVLAHRLGLLPLAVDPRLLKPLNGESADACPDSENLAQLDPASVVVFDLKARCRRNPKAAATSTGFAIFVPAFSYNDWF